MNSYKVYALSSLALTGSTLYYAYYTKYQFFPVLVYLYSSKIASLVIGNFFILTLLSFGQLVKYIFFGELTDIEKESVQDNIKSSLMEILLLMTIFRGEFSTNFIFYIAIMLFFKIFHWMLEQRVNFMEQLPPNDKVTYIKMLALLLVLFLSDLTFITYAIYTISNEGASIQILFGFEYALLFVAIVTISVKYAFVLISLSSDRTWEKKGEYMIYLEFASNSFKMLIYNAFFGLLFKYYGLPLYMIRSVYMAWGKFYSSWIKLKKYRKAVAEMNIRFPDASLEDIQRVEGTCIVCREEMLNAKKLPCQHIMHKHCLTTYLESSLNCPLCRAPLMVDELPNQNNQQIFNLLQQVMQNNNNGINNNNGNNNLNGNRINLNNLFGNLQNVNNGNNLNLNFGGNQNNQHYHNNQNNLNDNLDENVNVDHQNLFQNVNRDGPLDLYDAIEKLQAIEEKMNSHEKQFKQLQGQLQFLQEFIMEQVEKQSTPVDTKEDKEEIDNGKEDVTPVIERKHTIQPKDNLNDSTDLDMNEIRRRRVMKFSGSTNLQIDEDVDN